MPDEKGKPLPPLSEEAFDGEKHSIKLSNKKCHHKNIKMISSHEIRCGKCGAGWFGLQIERLYKAMKSSH